MKKYDLIIVGAGPSGVFCAYELIKKNKLKNVLIIEQGKRIEDRFCPIEKAGKCLHCKPFCSITSGFSGAGAFSDGKLNSYHLSLHNQEGDLYLGGNGGGYIKQYMSSEDIKDLLAYTDGIYLSFGADPHLHGIDHRDEIVRLQRKAKENDLMLVDFPIRHLGTEKAHELYSKIEKFLEENGVEMIFNTSVLDLIIEDGVAKGVAVCDVLNKKSFEIFSDKIVLGIGRKGAGWLSDICQRHNIETAVGSVDIGVRYELPDDVMREINTYLYEGKFIGRPKPFCDRVRTFCQNPSGFVSAEVYDNNLTLVNGHSYKDRKSTNTNLAILVSHNFNTPFNKPIEYGENIAENVNRLAAGSVLVQRFGDILNGKRTWEKELLTNSVKPTLKSAVAGDITYAIGFRTMTDIINFIKQVDHVVPGFAGEDNLLYAPEIKFYSNTVVVDKNFETSVKNLFCIGDGGGLTTGLMMASASGVKMARNLISLEDKN